MHWESIHRLSDEAFKRLTGVKRSTFEKMLDILKEYDQQKKSRGGRPNKLSVEAMLIMELEYLREYRTYFHIAKNYRVSESYAYKIIRWVEDTLIKSKEFHLPGKKELLKSDVGHEVIGVCQDSCPLNCLSC